MPAISVIIPVYNRPQLLQTALESVVTQSFTDYEIIVVDDGSTVDLPTEVPALGHRSVRFVRQANQGAGAARNTGLAAAQGEFVSFLDSDDQMLPHNLECLHAALRSQPDAGMAHGWATTVDHTGAEAQWTRPRLNGRAYRHFLFGNPNLMGTLLVRRACFSETHVFDGNLPLFEDWDLWLRLSFHHDFTYVPRRVVRVIFQRMQRTTSQPVRLIGETVRRIYAKLYTDPVAEPLVRHRRRQLDANVHVMTGHQYRLFAGDLVQARREFVRGLRCDPTFRPAYFGLVEALVGLRVTRLLRSLRSGLLGRT